MTYTDRIFRSKRLMVIHIGVLVIFIGAIVTCFTGNFGSVHLRAGAGQAATWRDAEGRVLPMPFRIGLDTLTRDKAVVRVSEISGDKGYETTVIAPNRPLMSDGYRILYGQTDTDGDGMMFTVARDMPGTILVFAGYALLLGGMIAGLKPIRTVKRNGGTGKFRIADAILLVAALLLFGKRWMTIGTFPAAGIYDTLLIFSIIILGFGVMGIASKSTLAAGVAAIVVAMLTGDNGGVSAILSTPLLGVHVVLVVIAYVLFGVAALLAMKGEVKTASGLVYPGVTMLTAGVIVGSIWATIAWGRYWSWDPKETSALVTLLIYLVPLHVRMKNVRTRRIYLILAFGAVLFTWFVVSYLFTGLHTYA